jgi:hypothetical protein
MENSSLEDPLLLMAGLGGSPRRFFQKAAN